VRTGPSIIPGIAEDYYIVLNSYGRLDDLSIVTSDRTARA